MIFDGYIKFILGVLTSIVALFPEADLSHVEMVTQQFSTFQDFTASATYFLPVGAVWDVILIIFAVEFSLAVYKFTRHTVGAVTAGVVKV